MNEEDERIQQEWDEHEKKRMEQRRKILADLRTNIERDEELLEKFKGEQKKDEKKEVEQRLSANRDILMVLDDSGEYDNDSLLDWLLDRPVDSHGGTVEDSGVNVLPMEGMGLVAVIEMMKLVKRLQRKMSRDE